MSNFTDNLKDVTSNEKPEEMIQRRLGKVPGGVKVEAEWVLHVTTHLPEIAVLEDEGSDAVCDMEGEIIDSLPPDFPVSFGMRFVRKESK